MAYTYEFELLWTIANDSPYYDLPENDPPTEVVRKDRAAVRSDIEAAVSAVTSTLGSLTFNDPQTDAQLASELQQMIDAGPTPTWKVGDFATPKSEWVWRDGQWVLVTAYILDHDDGGTYAPFTTLVNTVAGDVRASYQLLISAPV